MQLPNTVPSTNQTQSPPKSAHPTWFARRSDEQPAQYTACTCPLAFGTDATASQNVIVVRPSVRRRRQEWTQCACTRACTKHCTHARSIARTHLHRNGHHHADEPAPASIAPDALRIAIRTGNVSSLQTKRATIVAVAVVVLVISTLVECVQTVRTGRIHKHTALHSRDYYFGRRILSSIHTAHSRTIHVWHKFRNGRSEQFAVVRFLSVCVLNPPHPKNVLFTIAKCGQILSTRVALSVYATVCDVHLWN